MEGHAKSSREREGATCPVWRAKMLSLHSEVVGPVTLDLLPMSRAHVETTVCPPEDLCNHGICCVEGQSGLPYSSDHMCKSTCMFITAHDLSQCSGPLLWITLTSYSTDPAGLTCWCLCLLTPLTPPHISVWGVLLEELTKIHCIISPSKTCSGPNCPQGVVILPCPSGVWDG